MLLSYLKELWHCLIGVIIVSFLIWLLIKIHLYFSSNNLHITESGPESESCCCPGSEKTCNANRRNNPYRNRGSY